MLQLFYSRCSHLVLSLASLVLIAAPATAEDSPPRQVERKPVVVRDVPPDQEPAKKIVYVIDATGSMMALWDAISAQLQAAIAHLEPSQSFGVVLINEHNPEPLAKELLAATPENKRKADEYIRSMAPRGGIDPVPALTKAFALKPEVIFLMIDPSQLPNKKAILTLAGKDENKKIRIDVIVVEGHSDDKENEKFLKDLAMQSGGVYKFVSASDLSPDKK